MKAGVTGWSLAILRSVLCSASRISSAALGLSKHCWLSGNNQPNRSYSIRASKDFSAWPERNSFKTSSNSLAGGMLPSRKPNFLIGFAVLGSISKPSFARKRIARSMRTGSSLKRFSGSPMSLIFLASISAVPSTKSSTCLRSAS